MDAGFRDDIHVEAVAEVDGVDVVAFQVGVHDGEEDLEEEVDGVEEDGKEEEPGVVALVWSLRRGRYWMWMLVVPCFARHHGGLFSTRSGRSSTACLRSFRSSEA